jgi:hypothetical protein
MKSILDPSFHYTSSGQTDIRRTFERVWRELGVRERPERVSVLDRDPVRTVRNGEPRDIGWVDAIVIRESVPGIEVITCVPFAGPPEFLELEPGKAHHLAQGCEIVRASENPCRGLHVKLTSPSGCL